MRRTVALLGLLSVSFAVPTLAAEPPQAKPKPALGINIAGPADWNTELPFVDVFRFSRAWISQKQGAPWGKGPALSLDARGWVRRLEPGCWAETPLCTIEGGHYPSGKYVVLYEGEGRIETWGAARVAESRPGRLVLDVDAKRGGFFLKLVETNPSNHVRDIRVLMPGFESTYKANPWNPTFLDRWRGVSCLRFMDLMETNGSKVKTPSDRPKVDEATWTRAGVPLEVLIDLANRLKADAWFCIPHEADDAYVAEFARVVKAGLAPGRKAYVEYSNEVWNGGFVQHRYAGERGIALGLAKQPWEAAWRYDAQRSLEIFTICEPILGKDRMVRVLASQAAVPYVSEKILEHRDAGRRADVLAIAPYVSLNVSVKGKTDAATVASLGIDGLMDHVERVSLPEAEGWIKAQKKVADKYGLTLVCYEAGQHLVGVAGAENDEALTKLLTAANAHPRMEKIYERYYQAWVDAGGDLLCHFSSVGNWSKWGSWGLLRFADEPVASSPKFRATAAWAKKLGRPLGGK